MYRGDKEDRRNKGHRQKNGFLETFCLITELAAGVFCILYLLDVLHSRGILNLILILALMLHGALLALSLRRRESFLQGLLLALTAYYVVCFCYINLAVFFR